jgi:hypothetical protein
MRVDGFLTFLHIETMKEHLEYLSLLIKGQGMSMDWQGKKKKKKKKYQDKYLNN